jgi:hypothetical protein
LVVETKLLKSIDIVSEGGSAGGVSFFFTHPQYKQVISVIAKKNKTIFFIELSLKLDI